MSKAATMYPDPPNRMAGEEGFMDKTVLVTGSSGFLGKVFIEKLLRTCPLVNKIYLIMRTKRGKDPQARLKDIFSIPLYDLLKQTRGEEILKKVIVIPGDFQEPDLGLSPVDRKLLTEEVQIIYHLAATTRFDEPYKKAVFFNTRGAKLMLELAKECKQLLMFLHCSTAYCFPHENILYEQIYDPPADPELIINICETMDDETIGAMSNTIMRNFPNTYTYSKALAEGLVVKEMDNLPILIMRPSVVVPIWKDPLPGWVDNFYGPVGILTAVGKGVLKTVHCKPKSYADFISVDMVANALICSLWFYKNNQKIRIYNLATTSEIKITWSDILNLGIKIVTSDVPLNWVVWYPRVSLTTSKLLHQIYVILFHYIPAVFLASLIVLTGNKPVLWKVQQKITYGSKLLEFYANRKWEFNNDNLRKVREQLNKTEKNIYKLDVCGLDIQKYFYEGTFGVRRYLLKEGDETLPTARRHLKMMWAVDIICKVLLLVGFLYLCFEYFINPTL